MGGCQNYGPLLGTLSSTCRNIIGIQTGTIILTTTQMKLPCYIRVIWGIIWVERIKGFKLPSYGEYRVWGLGCTVIRKP